MSLGRSIGIKVAGAGVAVLAVSYICNIELTLTNVATMLALGVAAKISYDRMLAPVAAQVKKAGPGLFDVSPINRQPVLMQLSQSAKIEALRSEEKKLVDPVSKSSEED